MHMPGIDKLEANAGWRGERQVGSGAPRKTGAKLDAAIVKYVLKERGRKKVTVSHLRTVFPSLRGLGDDLAQDR